MRRVFGTAPGGEGVDAIEIAGARMSATILTHGARLHALRVDTSPNLIAGSPDLEGYLGAECYHGAVVGPVANRIAGAHAEIDGVDFHFEANQNGLHTLHSGEGLHSRIWEISASGKDCVELSIRLPDGEGGFPGNREIRAEYRVDGLDLCLGLTATTDAPTLMNLAHHGYWSLDGTNRWAGHVLEIATDRYLPVDPDLIPSGEIARVAGTPYDHRTPRAPDPSLDHNFCFDISDAPRRLATLTGGSGRSVDVISDAPGLQVYAGNPRGIALEPQLWPDAPHHAGFPSILLAPGERFRQRTIFRLGPP